MKIPFGKYKGHTLDYVHNHDIDYFKWLATIELKGPIGEEYEKASKKFEKLDIEDETKRVDKYIKIIEKEASQNLPVYYVNIHSVGIEYRFYTPERILINTENICNNRYYICGKDVVSMHNFNRLEQVMNKYWRETGKQWQTRGLY